MEKTNTRYLFVFLALLMWALSFPSIKVALEEVDPLTLAAVRFIFPLPIIYIFYRYEQREIMEEGTDVSTHGGGEGGIRDTLRRYLQKERRMTILLSSFALFNVVLPNIFQNYGMQSASSGVSSIIQGSGPIFTIFLAGIFLKERLTHLQIFGIMLAFVGSLLLVSGGEMEFDGSTEGKVLILLSAISYAISGIFAKILLQDIHAGELTLKSFLIGGAVLASLALIVENPVDLVDLNGLYWYHIAYIALFPTGLAFIFWFRALKALPLSELSISVFLVPVMAVIFSAIFLNEEVTVFTLGTGAMVILGVLIAQVKEKGNPGTAGWNP